jgi:neutral ceramidase
MSSKDFYITHEFNSRAVNNKMKESRRSFIKKSTLASTSLMMPGIDPFYSTKVFAKPDISASFLMKAGFAELDITPEIGMEQPGGYGKSYHSSFHDPCKVRAVVFDDGSKRSAIVGIDTLIIPRSLVVKVRENIQAKCGIPYEAILIGASHSHSSGPLGMVQPGEYDHAGPFVRTLAYEKSSCADPEYMELVGKRLVEVVCRADNSREETSLGVGTGIEDKVAFNRRFRMKNGLTCTHPRQGNPEIIEHAGPTDPEVGVIGVWNKRGKCIGCIVNFACHATTNPGGISANWIYYLEQTIRGTMGDDCIVVFLAGASGDITQVNNLSPFANPSSQDWTRFVGGRVGAEAVKVLLSMPRGIMTPLDFRITVMEMNRRPPDPGRVRRSYELVKQTPDKVGHTEWVFAKEIVLLDALLSKEPTVKVEVQALQVGPAVFVTNPAEFFCQLGLDIKNQSQFMFTFPVSLANGSVGYVPTKEAFNQNGGGYETRLTSYSNLEIQAGDKIVEAGLDLIGQMKPGNLPEFPKAPSFNGDPWEYGNVKPELK